MRKYVLHGTDRIYFEDSPVHYEIPCIACGTEIPEGQAFWMAGLIRRPEPPHIELGESAGTQGAFHGGCITQHVARLLANIPAEIPA